MDGSHAHVIESLPLLTRGIGDGGLGDLLGNLINNGRHIIVRRGWSTAGGGGRTGGWTAARRRPYVKLAALGANY